MSGAILALRAAIQTRLEGDAALTALIGAGRIHAGLFQLTSLEYRGDHAGEVTFDLSLESAGSLAFTAL